MTQAPTQDDQSVFTGTAWTVPPDARYYDVTGVGRVIVVVVTAPNTSIKMTLTYAVDAEDMDKFDFTKARDYGDTNATAFDQAYPHVIEGGNALELTGIPDGQTFADWFDDTWRRFVGYNPVVQANPEMANLYTEALLEGWSDNEIQSAVTTTAWWKNASTEQRQYQLLSPAQQKEEIQGQAGNLALTYFSTMGKNIPATDAFIMKLAEQVASGKITYAEATLGIQKEALKDPNTPHATQTREYNRRGVNIENKAGELRQVSMDWGIKASDQNLANWAKNINDLKSSDEDFATYMQGLAESQWGSREAGTSNRSRDTSVAEWASPYMASYANLMEYGGSQTADLLFDTKFRKHFTGDFKATVGDFEDKIRSSQEWRETNNGKAATSEMLTRVGSLMGFS